MWKAAALVLASLVRCTCFGADQHLDPGSAAAGDPGPVAQEGVGPIELKPDTAEAHHSSGPDGGQRGVQPTAGAAQGWGTSFRMTSSNQPLPSPLICTTA